MTNTFKTGNPIWVYYTDIDTGANLRVPQLLRGFIGTPFHIETLTFPNYDFVQAQGELNGEFDMHQHSVQLFYRRSNWLEVETINMYLKLTEPTQLYDGVEGMPIDTPLPGGITVKSFQRVATKQGAFWYEVNADRWLKYDSNTMQNMDEYPEDDNNSYVPQSGSQTAILPLNNMPAVVDYVAGQQLDVYDQPYGHVIGKANDGEHITIVGKINDDNGVIWYEAKDLGFLNAAYVDLLQ